MMSQLDQLWYRLLGALQRGLGRCAQAHRRREVLRRFREQVAAQRPELN